MYLRQSIKFGLLEWSLSMKKNDTWRLTRNGSHITKDPAGLSERYSTELDEKLLNIFPQKRMVGPLFSKNNSKYYVENILWDAKIETGEETGV